MGTPEFSDLGKHCMVEDCKHLDFLPFNCDRCHQVFCLEHQSYNNHACSKPNSRDATVVICPLCAKGVRLMPEEDPDISWETHVNMECDPSNYEKVTKKRKCPASGCGEVLVFSNTIKCRDCTIDHCLKHRFGPDHKCPGPKKPDLSFQLMDFLCRTKTQESTPNRTQTASSNWGSRFFNAASTVRASAEAGMSKFSNDISQAWQTARSGVLASTNNVSRDEYFVHRVTNGSGGNDGEEQCPQCGARFSSVTSLVEHVQKIHERRSAHHSLVINLPMDVCPNCSKGFRDPVALVEHVEREHA